ncbi:glycosyltransferase [Microbacterium sp. HMWF026]|uniref:glycosyltransferase n=1 Tax=Microbacterium sp. HMWF026 TaxID=2056861 RepID=UPI0015E80888|nr:glycosyltransferase [Microbacterium sp. HMWF026]
MDTDLVKNATTASVFGYPALFELVDGSEVPALSPRESRILVGAVNFHTAIVPGRVLRFHVYDGDDDLTPRTTDDRTFDGRSRIFRKRLFSFTARGFGDAVEIDGSDRWIELVGRPDRHIHVSPDAVLDKDPRRWEPKDLLRKVARQVRAAAPLMYDELRDLELRRHKTVLTRPAQRRSYLSEFASGGQHEDDAFVPAGPLAPNAPPAVLVGVHWFELGGAERWAFETVRAVREAGLLPVVLSSVDSHHPFIDRAELDGALVIPFSEPTATSQPPGREPLLSTLLERFDFRGVIVHHNQWLYDRLPFIAISRPGIPIVDSTHIVEHRGGGYAMSAVLADDYITTHHVISPALKRWMSEVQQVDPDKVVMAPLIGLTADATERAFREPAGDRPFTVAFVGRMARQKAPEIFVEAARVVHRTDPDIRFIVHGDGEHQGWVGDLIDRGGLGEAVIRRTSAVPVAQTMADTDLLVVTSANEGLTLTTLEALAHGLPVVSTDVGAQSDIIPAEGLVPANPHRAVTTTAAKILALSHDVEARRRLWQAEVVKERALLAETPASAWFERLVKEWSMSPQSS